jgi:DNA-binding protein HU-beta
MPDTGPGVNIPAQAAAAENPLPAGFLLRAAADSLFLTVAAAKAGPASAGLGTRHAGPPLGGGARTERFRETLLGARSMATKKAMTKSQIMNTLAEKTGLQKKEVQTVVEALVDLACKEAKNGFKIPDLGKLELKNRKARMGRNPQTGEPIRIPAKRVLKFRIAKAAKDKVLGPK